MSIVLRTFEIQEVKPHLFVHMIDYNGYLIFPLPKRVGWKERI